MTQESYEVGLVSIVIPTYNQEKFIRETIESVLKQTYKNIEIIVSDDCSNDGTIQMLKQLEAVDSRIKLLLSDRNYGIPHNFNKAFDAVRGEFVAFLGGDDIMYPQKVKKMVAVLQSNQSVGLVYSDMLIRNSKTGNTTLHSERGIHQQPLDWVLKVDWFLEKRTGILPSACLARSNYYLQVRYDERFYLKHELWFTIQDYYKSPGMKWVYLDEVLGEYKVHGANFSESVTAKERVVHETFLLADLCMEQFPESKKRVKEHLQSFAFRNLVHRSNHSAFNPRFLSIYQSFRMKHKAHLFFTRILIGSWIFPLYGKFIRLLRLF